jgi:threonine dehydrogenase-like Zn-dependent dehydrogenase
MRDVRIYDEPIPIADAGEKLVRIKAVGVCDSDLHGFLEREIGDAKLDHPLILGHAFAGGTRNGQGLRLTLRSRAGIANIAN